VRSFALLVLGMVSAYSLWSQSVTPTPTPTPVPTTVAQTAEAYTDQEFPPWVLKVRRAEILAVGAFPLAYLFAGLGYDYYYYLSQYSPQTGFPQAYAPWPVGPGTSGWTVSSQPDLVKKKTLTLVSISLITGLVLATVDWWLGEQKP